MPGRDAALLAVVPRKGDRHATGIYDLEIATLGQGPRDLGAGIVAEVAIGADGADLLTLWYIDARASRLVLVNADAEVVHDIESFSKTRYQNRPGAIDTSSKRWTTRHRT